MKFSYVYFHAMRKVANKLFNGRTAEHTLFGQRIHSQEIGGGLFKGY